MNQEAAGNMEPKVGRVKNWDELTQDEKIERVHLVVSSLRYTLDRIQTTVSLLERHGHGVDGRPTAPLPRDFLNPEPVFPQRDSYF